MPPQSPFVPAVRSESAAPYAAPRPAAPTVTDPVLARIERAGPAALEDHELLGLLGLDVDAATLAASGACASSSTTPTTSCTSSCSRPSTVPGCMRCTKSTLGGWKPGFAAMVRLHCFSEERANKERAIVERFATRFEQALTQMSEGLSRPRTEKRASNIRERIGRLKAKSRGIAQHYHIDIDTDPIGERATAVRHHVNHSTLQIRRRTAS